MRWWMLGTVLASHIGIAYGLANVASSVEVQPKHTSGVQVSVIASPKPTSLTPVNQAPAQQAKPHVAPNPAPPVVPSKPVSVAKPSPAPVAQPQPAPIMASAQESQTESTPAPVATPTPEPIITPSAPEFVAANGDAAHLHNPKPVYPEESLDNEEEGTVLLNVYITEVGGVSDITLKQTSGYIRLDEAALQTVKRWTFVPAMRQGVAVAGWHTQRIHFKLQ